MSRKRRWAVRVLTGAAGMLLGCGPAAGDSQSASQAACGADAQCPHGCVEGMCIEEVAVQHAEYVRSTLAPDGTLALLTHAFVSKLDADGQQHTFDISVPGNQTQGLSLAASADRVFVGRMAEDMHRLAWSSVLGWWANPPPDLPHARGTFRLDELDGWRAPVALCRQTDAQWLVAGSHGLLERLLPSPVSGEMEVHPLAWPDRDTGFLGLWCNAEEAIAVGSNNTVVRITETGIRLVDGPGPERAALQHVTVHAGRIYVSGTAEEGAFVALYDDAHGWRRFPPLPEASAVTGLALGAGKRLFVLQGGRVLTWQEGGWKAALEPGFPLITTAADARNLWLAGHGDRVFRLFVPEAG